MSEIVGFDTWGGRITRVYVWYPTCEAGADWRNDPAIQHIIVPMGDRVRSLGGFLDGAVYYWHKYCSGCVRVITGAFHYIPARGT